MGTRFEARTFERFRRIDVRELNAKQQEQIVRKRSPFHRPPRLLSRLDRQRPFAEELPRGEVTPPYS